MAGYLVDDGVDELEIPGTGGEKVVMRRQAYFSDDLAVGTAVVGVPDEERTERFLIARALVMIESWTLKARDGSPLPLDMEAFGPRGLNRKVSTWLSNEAGKRWGDRPEDAELPFDSPSNQPPTAEQPSTLTLSPSSPSSTSVNGAAGLPTSSPAVRDD